MSLSKSELRGKIVEILGLETAPNGDPDFLLIRDGNGIVLEGTSYTEEVDQLVRLFDQAWIDGMEQAKSRVLRRTEIPKGVKNPTRDYVVLLGEEIAGFINQDIERVNYQTNRREVERPGGENV